jgi:nitrogen fixation protein FixH
MSEARPRSEGLRGQHVLLALFAFFGVMLIANGIFLYYALATFGGGDTSDPYRKGLHYNETLAEAARQTERGWTGKLSYDHSVGLIVLELRDRQDQPVRGVRIGGSVERPATDREDVPVGLKEGEPGSYTASIRLAPGQWVAQLHSQDVSSAGEPTYRLKQRFFVGAQP